MKIIGINYGKLFFRDSFKVFILCMFFLLICCDPEGLHFIQLQLIPGPVLVCGQTFKSLNPSFEFVIARP